MLNQQILCYHCTLLLSTILKRFIIVLNISNYTRYSYGNEQNDLLQQLIAYIISLKHVAIFGICNVLQFKK